MRCAPAFFRKSLLLWSLLVISTALGGSGSGDRHAEACGITSER